MTETRRISPEYAELAAEVIGSIPALQFIEGSGATIVYLASDSPKRSRGRAVCAECELVPSKHQWAIPADFAIVVYEPNCQGMTDAQMRALMHHELLHVGIERTEDGGERYRIRPHDLEDFHEIIDRYGPDWAEVG